MYITMFPQLVAGPIVRYSDVQEQLTNRTETLDKFAAGMRLFVIGLAKKVLLANIVAMLAADMLALGGSSIGAVGAWSGLLAYTFQIFFDFSGYSDMAIGLGRMLGFDFPATSIIPTLLKALRTFGGDGIYRSRRSLGITYTSRWGAIACQGDVGYSTFRWFGY